DHPLRLPAIAHRPACLGHAGVQSDVADELPWPQLLPQLLLVDNAVAMGEEIGEHLKHFGADVDQMPCAVQLAALRVEGIVAKHVEHGRYPLCPRLCGSDTGWAPLHPRVQHTRKIPGNHKEITRSSSRLPACAAVHFIHAWLRCRTAFSFAWLSSYCADSLSG